MADLTYSTDRVDVPPADALTVAHHVRTHARDRAERLEFLAMLGLIGPTPTTEGNRDVRP